MRAEERTRRATSPPNKWSARGCSRRARPLAGSPSLARSSRAALRGRRNSWRASALGEEYERAESERGGSTSEHHVSLDTFISLAACTPCGSKAMSQTVAVCAACAVSREEGREIKNVRRLSGAAGAFYEP